MLKVTILSTAIPVPNSSAIVVRVGENTSMLKRTKAVP